jgi:hypothetical protein
MNRFPIVWVVRFVLPETKAIEKVRLTRMLLDIDREKSAMKNGQLLTLLFLAIMIPYLLIFALPTIWFIVVQGEAVDMVDVIKIGCPLLLLSIYSSLAVFTLVNARVFAVQIRQLATRASAI